MRILIVEDQTRMAQFLARGLREQSYAADLAFDGEDALYQISINDYDLIILDVMLPHKDGFQVCREIRNQGIKTPIIMLTARDSVDDRINGLDSGADDYLVKPFDFKELLARLRALLRRGYQASLNYKNIFVSEIITILDLQINTTNHQITRSGRSIILTAKEYALLEFFILHTGNLLTRSAIAEHVWDQNFDPFSNIIDVYVRRLRKKIDQDFFPPLIHTRRGEGYIFGHILLEDDKN